MTIIWSTIYRRYFIKEVEKTFCRFPLSYNTHGGLRKLSMVEKHVLCACASSAISCSPILPILFLKLVGNTKMFSLSVASVGLCSSSL